MKDQEKKVEDRQWLPFDKALRDFTNRVVSVYTTTGMVVQLVSMADSSTEEMPVLLTALNSCHCTCITRT